MTDLNKRLELAPKRIKKLFEKYPVVGYGMIVPALAIGLFLGWVIWH